MTTITLKKIPENIKKWNTSFSKLENAVIKHQKIEIDTKIPVIYLSVNVCKGEDCQENYKEIKNSTSYSTDGKYNVFNLTVDKRYMKQLKDFVKEYK